MIALDSAIIRTTGFGAKGETYNMKRKGGSYNDPRHDLDRDNFSLVKTLADGRHGAAYPNMPWEPKESFSSIADYYGRVR